MSSSSADYNANFQSIFYAIETIEGNKFFENDMPKNTDSLLQSNAIPIMDQDQPGPSGISPETLKKNLGPLPQEDIEVFLNLVETLKRSHEETKKSMPLEKKKKISTKKLTQIVEEPVQVIVDEDIIAPTRERDGYFFQTPDRSWLIGIYEYLKIDVVELKNIINMEQYNVQLKRHKIKNDKSLFRALSFIIFKTDEYYDKFEKIINNYKNFMGIKLNQAEMAQNDNLRAFAKLFAVNILIFVIDGASGWKCYGPGEMYFEKLNDLVKKEYKNRTYLRQKPDFPCLCLFLEEGHFDGIIPISTT